MDNGWIALLGVAAGAIISGGFVLGSEKYRSKRERVMRADERRLDAYSAFLGETLLARSPTEWIAVGRVKDILARRQVALRAIAMGCARLNLLASDEVKEAADALAEAVGQDIARIADEVSWRKRIPSAHGEESDAAYQRLRLAFEQAVRRERNAED